jgi:hypothetical protein
MDSRSRISAVEKTSDWLSIRTGTSARSSASSKSGSAARVGSNRPTSS